MTAARARLGYGLATAAIVALGLLVRTPALGLPWPVAKYLGSALWGAMVFTALRTISPRLAFAAGWALLIALGVEASRRLHTPALDAFRLTLAGRLMLGRLFSLWNVVAYAAGIFIAAALARRA